MFLIDTGERQLNVGTRLLKIIAAEELKHMYYIDDIDYRSLSVEKSIEILRSVNFKVEVVH
jgi:hypothetical protein